MIESGYYPAGAEFDPRAPYNEPDNSWIEKEAREIAYNECETDCRFWEWIVDEYNLDYDDKRADAICLEYRDKEEVFDKYFEDVRDYYEQEAIDSHCDYEPDYERDY